MMLIAACVSEYDIIPDNGGGQGGNNRPSGGENPVIALRLSFPATEVVNTKAISAIEENQIDSLRLFVFRNGGTLNRLDDVYMYQVSIPQDSLTDDTSSPNHRIKMARVAVRSATYKQYFVLVANPTTIASFPFLTEDVSMLRDLANALTYSGDPWLTEPVTATYTPFPMWGQIADSLEINAYNSPGSPVPVYMIRSVAKIEIGVDVNHTTGDPALGFGSVFVIDSVYVCNAQSAGYVAPHTTFVNSLDTVISITHTITGDPRSSRGPYEFPKQSDPTASSLLALTRAIYVPETDTLQGGTLSPAYLVIKAAYYGVTSYYRIDFTRSNHYLPLLRNKSYMINITGIRKLGFATLQEAIDAPVLTLNPSLILDDVEVDINDIVYNKDYWFGAGTTDKKVDWMGQNNITIPVKTSYPGGWGVIGSTGALFNGAPTTTASLLSFNVSDNYTGADRTGVIQIAAGTLSMEIKVTQSLGSNTYIVSAGQPFRIPRKSMRVTDTSTGLETLWGPVTASYGADEITGTAGTTPGATVISVKNASGIVWSWTVWTIPAGVNLNPEATANRHTYNGYTFMDYDLGSVISAVSPYPQTGLGPFYQWGRKDPFPNGYESMYEFSIDLLPAPNLNTSFAHPTTFYANSNSPYDWKGDGQHNSLWATIEGEKGPYDPCPFGWRVPPAENNAVSPWNGFANNDNGLYFNPSSPGYNGTTGLPFASAPGYYWSASVRGTLGYGYKAGVGGQNANRSNAYPVRCVRDNIKRN
jgi:hypothetical protein